jgi:uncharacterized protein (DUF488 family)
MTDTIYTIGHSTHSVERFAALLKFADITVVSDVRSKPYSRTNPQFNREQLKEFLRAQGIKYVFLGKELGARSDDPSCYQNGQVQYALLAKTDLFKHGIERVKKGARTYRVALMCAEKDPLDCHRTILVARHLADEGMSVKHILANGRVEDHEQAIERLVSRFRGQGNDIFQSPQEIIDEAYARRGNEIAYHEEATADQSADDRRMPGVAA